MNGQRRWRRRLRSNQRPVPVVLAERGSATRIVKEREYVKESNYCRCRIDP